MNKEIVQQLTSSFPILKKQGYKALHFKFAGGEPFLNFKLLKDSFFLFKKNCQKLKLSFHCSIISNGTVYNQDIVDFLKNQNEISLTISVDGFGKCHDKNRVFVNGRGSFRTVITNIKKFCESGFKPNLSVSIDNSNCDGLKQLFVFCKRHNIQFTINFIRDSQQNDPLIFIKKMVKNYQYLKKIIPLKQSLLSTLGDRAYLDNYHLYPCDVENDYAIIDHFGEIYKCQMLINQKEHVWGNVFNKNWPILFKQKRQINISVEDRKQCSNCDWKYFCAGGCPLFNHFSKFSIGNQSNCIIYKNILPIIIELEIRQRICHN